MSDQLPAEALQATNEAARFIAECLTNRPIQNHDEYANAAVVLKEVKKKIDWLEEKRLGITRPMDVAKQRIMDIFNPPTKALKNAEIAIKNSMVAFQSEVARLARIEQDKLDAALAAQAEAEKAKLEAQAVKLVQDGLVSQAAALIAKSEDIQPVEMTLKVVQPVIQGVSTRTIWKFRVVDESKIPREYLSVNEVKLGAFARATKGLVAVEGIEFYSQQIIGA